MHELIWKIYLFKLSLVTIWKRRQSPHTFQVEPMSYWFNILLLHKKTLIKKQFIKKKEYLNRRCSLTQRFLQYRSHKKALFLHKTHHTLTPMSYFLLCSHHLVQYHLNNMFGEESIGLTDGVKDTKGVFAHLYINIHKTYMKICKKISCLKCDISLFLLLLCWFYIDFQRWPLYLQY